MLSFIQQRLTRFLLTMGPRQAAQFRNYWHTSAGRSDSKSPAPYWALLPGWLLGRYQKKQEYSDRRFLHDVVWAQHCLFFGVRIRDDLFDGQATGKFLEQVAGKFLAEAEKVFAKHFDRQSRFWKIEKDFLTSTREAIDRVDGFQRVRDCKYAQLVRAYARVGSIFKTGAAAVCLRTHRWKDFRRIGQFADEIAMASQIVDDAEDIGEDLERGRYNSVALFALNGERNLHSGDVVQQFCRDLCLERIIDEVDRHLNRAARAIGPLRIPAVREHIARFQRALTTIEARLQDQQAKMVLRQFISFVPGTNEPIRKELRQRRSVGNSEN